jgi:hypothetical protein
MALNILEYARDAKIHRDPFPHLVVDDILPDEAYAALEATFPAAGYIAELPNGRELANNRTYLRTSVSSLSDPDLPAVWREFIDTHSRRAVFESAISIWRDELARCHPGLEKNFGKPIDAFKAAQRVGKGDSEANRRADVMIDCQFGINSPVRKRSTARAPHVDRGAKLFSALLYFRDEQDESEGGEYELYRLRQGPFPRKKSKKIPARYIELVKRIPYRSNSLIMWLNTKEAIHAVAPRGVTKFPRRYVAISGECFGGAHPSQFFSHFDAWDRPLGRLRASIGLF